MFGCEKCKIKAECQSNYTFAPHGAPEGVDSCPPCGQFANALTEQWSSPYHCVAVVLDNAQSGGSVLRFDHGQNTIQKVYLDEQPERDGIVLRIFDVPTVDERELARKIINLCACQPGRTFEQTLNEAEKIISETVVAGTSCAKGAQQNTKEG